MIVITYTLVIQDRDLLPDPKYVIPNAFNRYEDIGDKDNLLFRHMNVWGITKYRNGVDLQNKTEWCKLSSFSNPLTQFTNQWYHRGVRYIGKPA